MRLNTGYPKVVVPSIVKFGAGVTVFSHPDRREEVMDLDTTTALDHHLP
jgi:hypothetical protein